MKRSDRVVDEINEFKKNIKAHFADLRVKTMQILPEFVYDNIMSFYLPSEFAFISEAAFFRMLNENLPDNDVLKGCFYSRYSKYKPIYLCFLKMLYICNVSIDKNLRYLYRRFALEFYIEVVKQSKVKELTKEKTIEELKEFYGQMLPSICNEIWDIIKGDEKNGKPFKRVFAVFEEKMQHNFVEFMKGSNALVQQLMKKVVIDVEQLYDLVDKFLQKNMHELINFRNKICLFHHRLILRILQRAVDDNNFKKMNFYEVD